MTTHNITVTATDSTKSAFGNIERSLAGLNSTASKLTSTFAALIGGLSVARVIESASAYQDLEVRLKAVSAAGTDTKALLSSLAAASSGTAGGVATMVEAYAQLKLAGLDASTSTIASLKNLAGASGNELGRTADIIGKAFRGEFGKLDDFGIEVENRAGKFVVKYQGQTQAIVSSTGQVVNEIIKLSNTNASFADAALAKSKSLDTQISKLRGTVEKGIGSSNLADSLSTLISKVNEFFISSGSITKAANYLAAAINFLGDNFNSIMIILGGVIGYFKIFGPLAVFISDKVNLIGKAMLAAGSGMAYFRGLLTGGFTAIVAGITQFINNWGRALGLLDSTYPVIASIMFAFRGLLVGLLRFAGWVGVAVAVVESINLVVKAFTGFDILDWVSDKFTGLIKLAKEWLGISAGIATTSASALPAGVAPSTAGAGRGNQGGASVTDITGGKPGKESNPFLRDMLENFAKIKGELSTLQSAMKGIKDSNILNLLFDEAASRAEKFGIILEKPIALIGRDFRLALDKSTESLRVEAINLQNTKGQMAMFSNELLAAEQASDKMSMRLDNLGLMTAKFYGELLVGANTVREGAMRLADMQYQQGKFVQNLQTTRQELEGQSITLRLLNEGYAAGTITMNEYVDALGGVNERLLTQRELTTQITANTQKEIAHTEAMTEAAGAALLAAGTMAEKLSIYKQYKTELGTIITLEKALQVEARKTMIEEDRKAKILRDSIPVYQEIANVAYDSTKKAGDALTQNLTEAIMTGKGLLSSFKDFFNTILNDIAAAIVKKQFVNPIVDSLTGMMTGGGGAGGIAGMISGLFKGGSQFTPGSNSFVGPMMPGAGGGGGGFMDSITQFFSGMFADGGTIPAGHFGIAGEAGAELITGPATVIPQSKLGGGDAPIVVNLSLNAIDTKSGVEFLVQNRAVITGVVQQAFNRNAKNGFA
jgi:ribosomal protein L17